MEAETTTASGRGQSKGILEWKTGVKVEILFDDNFQPVGTRAGEFKGQLGLIVRDGRRIPLTILDWKSVKEEVKEGIWKEVKENVLNVPDQYKDIYLRSCNNLWKDHKSKTKLNYFEKNKHDPELINKCPPHIVLEQWADLVAYWSSEVAQVIAKRNSCNREQRGPPHKTGRTHFSQMRYEMQQKGEEISKMNVWKKTRDQTNPEVSYKIKEYEQKLSLLPEDQRNLVTFKDKIFHEVIGDDGHGYCRTYGSSVPRRFVYPQSSSSSESTDDLVTQITMSVAAKLQEQQAQFQEQIKAELQEQMQQGFQQLHNRINNMLNKEENHNGQVPDATSGHDIGLSMESISAQPNANDMNGEELEDQVDE